ncbi:MAG: hypothetical protein ACP5NL_05030 [Thermoplasmata archaeon]
MLKIAGYSSIDIFAEESGFVTFLNSPFIAHREFKALDIFNGSRTYTDISAPVSGRVIEHKVHTMRKNGMREHVIVIDSGRAYVKILHAAPALNINDYVDAGELLGTLYQSPYFMPWTDPHIHIEIRPKTDYLRARGGFKLDLEDYELNGKFEAYDEYIVRDSYILRKIKPASYGPFYGAGDAGLIDGGYPYYKYGTVIGGFEPVFSGKKIGKLISADCRIFKFYDDKIIWNNIEFRGIGFYLYLNENAYLKYVFKDPATKTIFKN